MRLRSLLRGRVSYALLSHRPATVDAARLSEAAPVLAAPPASGCRQPRQTATPRGGALEWSQLVDPEHDTEQVMRVADRLLSGLRTDGRVLYIAPRLHRCGGQTQRAVGRAIQWPQPKTHGRARLVRPRRGVGRSKRHRMHCCGRERFPEVSKPPPQPCRPSGTNAITIPAPGAERCDGNSLTPAISKRRCD